MPVAPLKIIECPRDAMQGLETFIPTDTKVQYINKLLRVGFDTIDFGSFVSSKAVPQMRDTAAVVEMLDLENSHSSLLAIIPNVRGATEASVFEQIRYLGYPLSISETFQKRNTNRTIIDSLNDLEQIQNITTSNGKELVVYLSMGFGNPYGDPYDETIVHQFVGILGSMGVRIVSIADTVGVASPASIEKLLSSLVIEFEDLEIGAHLHSKPQNAFLAIAAAQKSGVKRIDGALLGFGGCPMADDKLVGNISTENIVSYLEGIGVDAGLDMKEYEEARSLAKKVFI